MPVLPVVDKHCSIGGSINFLVEMYKHILSYLCNGQSSD